MEIQFDSKPKKGSKKSQTKMYAPTHGRRKVMFAPATEQQKAEPYDAPETEEDVRIPARRKAELKPFTRLMLVVCSFIFAGMILFVLTGYERISRAYQEVNSINSSIETTELNINALDVAIECAVTIDQAKDWAKAHNMQYPLQSQYIVSGGSVPITGTGPDAAAPPDATTAPEPAETPATQPAATPGPDDGSGTAPDAE